MNDQGNDEVIRGTDVPPEVKAEFDSLRTVFDTKSALDRVDAYGKWLFASAAVVGSLGAGISNAAFAKLRGPGAWTFALAVVGLGICLVAASRSIAPQWVQVRLLDIASLRSAVNTQFGNRQRLLTIAAAFFALALGLAALSPLISLATTPKGLPKIQYTLDEKANLDSTLEGTELEPGTVFDLHIEAPNVKTQLPVSVGTVDTTGQLKITLRTSLTNLLSGNVDLVGCERIPQNLKCAHTYPIPILRH